MNLDWSKEDVRFREEVRDFLFAELAPGMCAARRKMTSVYSSPELALAWQAILNRRGWAAPAWPVEHGGCDWTLSQRYIFASELAAADAPPLSPMGIGMCGPVLVGHGTAAQKARYLPRILSAEDYWCQGYSEPDAGSDLARLEMSAVDDGDHLVCNGRKVWTTHAHAANWIFCLVRTSREAIPQRGITFLLIDMRSPGVETRPIWFISGEAVQSEVFFTDVRVPKVNVVGAIGDGWTVAKYLLLYERGGSVAAPGLRSALSRVIETARATDDGTGRPLIESPDVRARLAQLAAEVANLEAMELRVMSALAAGQSPGPESSMQKTLNTELSQKITHMAMELAGVYASPFQPHASVVGGRLHDVPGGVNDTAAGPESSWPATSRYFNDRAASIYAGTNEIQRNIMAKAILRV
jgi:alkylation response protein AidB-like acyl-CoA dehydrogenase